MPFSGLSASMRKQGIWWVKQLWGFGKELVVIVCDRFCGLDSESRVLLKNAAQLHMNNADTWISLYEPKHLKREMKGWLDYRSRNQKCWVQQRKQLHPLSVNLHQHKPQTKESLMSKPMLRRLFPPVHRLDVIYDEARFFCMIWCSHHSTADLHDHLKPDRSISHSISLPFNKEKLTVKRNSPKDVCQTTPQGAPNVGSLRANNTLMILNAEFTHDIIWCGIPIHRQIENTLCDPVFSIWKVSR